jgi:hypothetical protein
MDIRFNINKIDTILKENFTKVDISEKSSINLGKYFEIIVTESKVVKILLPFKNIDGQINFEFFYYANPLNESSTLIPRMTNLQLLTETIKDIISNNRFDQEYLKA